MKYLLILILIMACSFYAVSQEFTPKTFRVSANETWTQIEEYSFLILPSGRQSSGWGHSPGGLMNVSKYMWDDDDDYETIAVDPSGRHGIVVDGTQTYYTGSNGDTMQEGGYYDGYFIGVVQNENGAVFIYRDRESNEIVTIDLPGNTPEHDYMLANQRSSPGRVDTVYQLVTERIFTSDTVYLQETITLGGDVDTVVVNRTTTERIFTHDTIFSVNESFITRSDTLYMLPGQFAKDSKLILSTDNLDLKELLAYPNPAESVLTISSHTTRPSTLRMYDMAGEIVKTSQVSTGFNDTEINVSDLSSGMYVVMVVSQNERSKTRKVIVQ